MLLRIRIFDKERINMLRLRFIEPDERLNDIVKNDVRQTLAMMIEHGYTISAINSFVHYLNEYAPKLTIGPIRDPD